MQSDIYISLSSGGASSNISSLIESDEAEFSSGFAEGSVSFTSSDVPAEP